MSQPIELSHRCTQMERLGPNPIKWIKVMISLCKAFSLDVNLFNQPEKLSTSEAFNYAENALNGIESFYSHHSRETSNYTDWLKTK